jgi:mono/diheme cytochrome c family protein
MRRARWMRFAGPLLVLVAASRCEVFEEKVLHRGPGERLYLKLCGDCHGENGQGNMPQTIGNPDADLTLETLKYGTDPGSMAGVIRQGVFGSMPAHPELTDAQVQMLVDHILKLRKESRGPS